ncbi:hypothetical protein QBC45DRAFT_392811 [Copromyces sp. CBS 386.78]|nr:hypothetical protein QBC45DRAFT_392811 [Copromyces sp. CBS 386.78]
MKFTTTLTLLLTSLANLGAMAAPAAEPPADVAAPLEERAGNCPQFCSCSRGKCYCQYCYGSSCNQWVDGTC